MKMIEKAFRKLAIIAATFIMFIFATVITSNPTFAEGTDPPLETETDVINAETSSDDLSSDDTDASGKDTLIITETSSLTENENSAENLTDSEQESITKETSAENNEDGDNIVSEDEESTEITDADKEAAVKTEVNTAEDETPKETVKHLTVLEGVDYALVYDYEYYSANEDVKALCGDDELATLKNFVQLGMKAQRQGISTFDEVSYRRAYQDLRLAYGTDYAKYYLHYIKHGYKEGRKNTTGITAVQNPITVYQGVNYSRIYDYAYYVANQDDVKEAYGENDLATLKHFITYGMKEQRQASEAFDEKSYRRAYQDLRLAYGTDYKKYYEHYLECGYKEGRKKTTGVTEVKNPVTIYEGINYSRVYDYAYYIAKYEDIQKAYGEDDVATLNHFITCGMKEQRQAIETFDEKSYRRAYQDLRLAYGTDYKKYYEHYLKCGYKEGRKETTDVTEVQNPVTVYKGIDYSRVYDYAYYIAKYGDIQKAYGEDDVATLNHFITCGMKEQRQGSSAFDEVSYRYTYQDLRQAYRLNYASYYLHYINNGYKEERKTTGTTKMQNPTTVFAGKNYWNKYKNNTFSFDLSAVYDYWYYIGANPTLANKDDDFAMIENFAVNGMVNWIQGKESYSSTVYADLRTQVISYTQRKTKSTVVIGIAWGYESAALNWYTSSLSNAGARYVLLGQVTTVQQAKSVLSGVDGLLLTGGNDVTPSLYGETKTYAYNCNYARDISDMYLIQAAYEMDKATLGICRGLQIMNVAFNDPANGNYPGTLYQDLNAQGATSFSHMGNASVTAKRHDVYFTAGSTVATAYGTTTLSVTSAHHEGIKKLDTTHYVATGYATVGGTIIEAIEGIGKTFFVGIQFHPEALAASGEAQSLKIFRAFVEKARYYWG